MGARIGLPKHRRHARAKAPPTTTGSHLPPLRLQVRLSFRRPVKILELTIYQSFNPGSVVQIRGARSVSGAAAADSAWRVLWSGPRTNHDPDRPVT